MPTDISQDKFPDGFRGYFMSKIDEIRNNFVNNENFDEFVIVEHYIQTHRKHGKDNKTQFQ